jgi:hypothetical protein
MARGPALPLRNHLHRRRAGEQLHNPIGRNGLAEQ